MKTRKLSRSERVYLQKTTNYKDKIFLFFTPHTKNIPDRSNLSLASIPPLLIPCH